MGFVALLGVIALAGMIIRNAVILIGEADSNLAQGMTNDAAIIAAAEHRARPICLTACAAILGMIPISHQVFWGPMAYAIIGVAGRDAGHTHGTARVVQSVITVGDGLRNLRQRIKPGLC